VGRPIKEGLSYFPLDTDIESNRKIRLFRSDLAKDDRLSGFGIFVLVLVRIYGGKGYYILWDEDQKKMFCDELNIEINAVNNVINACINRGLFNKEKYEKYHVLTSSEIQQRFLGAVGRRKCIHVVDNYWINDDTKRVIDNINGINAGKKYTKEKKRNSNGINAYKNAVNVDIKDSSKICDNGHRYFGDFCPECKEEDNIEF